MRSRRATFFAAMLFAAIPGVAAAQSSGQPSPAQPSTVDQLVDKIVAQEKAEMQMLHQYSPLVETYIQLLRPDQTLGSAPAGDKYYLGKANLAKGLDLQPLTSDKGAPNLKYTAGGLGTFLTMSAPASADMPNTRSPSVIFAALPLGGRLKFDPWNNQLELLKAKPVGTVAEREKMPFEITPFILYLTRDKISPAETATITVD